MRARALTTLLLALLALGPACHRGPVLASRLQAAGGASALQQDCAGFVRMFEQSKGEQYAWMARDTNFPPAIASFSPQLIQVTRQGGVLLVDVRVTGGFMHHGLLVAATSPPKGFKPRMASWPVWPLASGVWEYRE